MIQQALINWVYYLLILGFPHNTIAVNDSIYTVASVQEKMPLYQGFLRLGIYPRGIRLDPFIRQPIPQYPGDYFWPPDTKTPMKLFRLNLHSELTVSEKQQISEFFRQITNSKSADSLIVSSLTAYAYDFPDGPRREAYGMFADGDTVYVISGWLGKFISFYRVVPGDFRMTVPELLKELKEITPLAEKLKGKESAFHQEADSNNYFLQYIDREGMFRVRNYLMKTVLPPSPPDSPDRFYNLIEVTKFYDKEVIP